MTAARRMRWNYALDRAIEHAGRLDKPLVVLEALRSGYPWASDRLHKFILDGMSDNRSATGDTPLLYYPYVEKAAGDGAGLLEALAAKACVVVTDDYPCFFLPKMLAAVASRLGVAVEKVDSNGLLPMSAADRTFPTAYAFRRFLQKTLPEHLEAHPLPDPLSRISIKPLSSLGAEIERRWPAATAAELGKPETLLRSIPLDHSVAPIAEPGGAARAQQALRRFINNRMASYADGSRNKPEEEVTSGLSPYLHFGHVSTHEIFSAICEKESWTAERIADDTRGKREGWWGMSPAAEGFLDQVVTWRELGFNMCSRETDYDRYESLPDWARTTLDEHRSDKRDHTYSLERFESATTHDPLWNAAQTQLVRDGRIHNYMRMLWGKKILEWSPSPEDALETMIELNNKYALDGRDPNSYSGIFWVLGRYDRAWGPERPIYGKIRYMSSDNTARKYRVAGYLENYAPAD
jgi:deoxyribodipyrimidine photo-lyase